MEPEPEPEPDGTALCAEAEATRNAEADRPWAGRGRCLLGNWQEERETEQLDRPSDGSKSEGIFFRHGHCGLLTLEPDAPLSDRTTSKDTYRRLHRTGLPERGKRQAMLEWLLTQKYRKEIFEEVSNPPILPTPLSTMHDEYRWKGELSPPSAPTKPHNYQLEQPQTFWKENAQLVPGISRVRTDDAPFRKCSIFTTPATEYLDLPWPGSPKEFAK